MTPGSGTPRLGLFGAPLDTGNLGVSALAIGALHGLTRRARFDISLFDHGRDTRGLLLRAGDWSCRAVQRPAAYSLRLHRRGNLRQLRWCNAAGLARLHPELRRMRSFRALLDISGGDSFTDLYGDWRFRAVTAPKLLALEMGVPLVLLPQTYGPFASEPRRAVSGRILREASQAWARDADSLDVLRELLGPDFDPSRHRAGVDVAFGLPALRPRPEVADAVAALEAEGAPLLGLNVSGLLYHGEAGRFGLRDSYRRFAKQALAALLRVDGARVLLVPHVVPPCTPDESDVLACASLAGELPAEQRERVWLAPGDLDAMEIKWVIGRCHWFSGARMHACIAALSQGTPTLGLAYSDKMRGVFATAGAAGWVADARELESGALLERLTASLAERDAMRDDLRDRAPALRERLDDQFDALIAPLREPGPGSGR